MIAARERETVVRLCRDLAAQGFFAATGGNLALRVDEAHFAVTPSALDYLAMTAADVCVLRLADLKPVEGTRPPSVESGLHARVLRRRRDCGCSIHTHQPAASACAVIGAPLEVADPKLRAILGARVPVVGYAPSGTGWLAGKLEAALRPEADAYLMRNHGALCCGAGPDEAVLRVRALEALCLAHLRARIAARPAGHPGRERILGLIGQTETDLS
jgi:L-fuculose-phosphate aldolase